MAGLPLETWVRFFLWLAIGLTIYFGFGKRRSELAYRRAATAIR